MGPAADRHEAGELTGRLAAMGVPPRRTGVVVMVVDGGGAHPQAANLRSTYLQPIFSPMGRLPPSALHGARMQESEESTAFMSHTAAMLLGLVHLLAACTLFSLRFPNVPDLTAGVGPGARHARLLRSKKEPPAVGFLLGWRRIAQTRAVARDRDKAAQGGAIMLNGAVRWIREVRRRLGKGRAETTPARTAAACQRSTRGAHTARRSKRRLREG